MPLSRHDWEGATRAFLLSLLVLLAVFIITAATSESGLTWRGWLARSVVVAPLAGALATALIERRRRSLGERTALEAVGVSPPRSALGPVVGGAVVGVLIAAAFAAGAAEPDAFYPELPGASATYTWNDGTFVDAVTGLAVAADGGVTIPRTPTEGRASAARGASERSRSGRRGSAVCVLALLAVALPLLASRSTGGSALLDWAVALLASLGLVVAFHAVAAGRLPAASTIVPAAGLLAWAIGKVTLTLRGSLWTSS